MKKTLLLLACCLVSLQSLAAQGSIWVLDQANSSVRFTVNHMMISEIEGRFRDFFASVQFEEDEITDSQFFLTVNVKSIDTGLSMRDTHLLSSDFFNASKFPEMRFKAQGIRPGSNGKLKVHGELTIKDITKPIAIDMKYGGIVRDFWGNKRAGFKLTGKFNRFDFGLDWNELLEAGGLIVGEDVVVTVNLEMFQQTEVKDLAEEVPQG